MTTMTNRPFRELAETLQGEVIFRSRALNVPCLNKPAKTPYPASPTIQSPVQIHHGGVSNPPTGTEDVVAEVHTCSVCHKDFTRLCDLNKHSKSHSRPFKCDHADCKYNTLGWPTAKELERHVNDKHASSPRTYACLFPPCPYRSKRESNCKQHMEKTHGWQYVRSKYSRKSVPESAQEHEIVSSNDSLPYPTPVSPTESMVPVTGGDFVLFPHEQAVYFDDEEMEEMEQIRYQDLKVFIPWTSPGTRVRKNETLIRCFNKAYDSSVIDPQLSRMDISYKSPYVTARHQASSSLEVRTATFNSTADASSKDASSKDTRSRAHSRLSQYSEHDQSAVHQRPISSSHPGQLQATQSNISLSLPMSFNLNAPSASAVKRLRGEEDDDEDQQSRKRLKTTPVPDFKDTEMPDVFQCAHPHLYNRDMNVLYSSCHSSHKDISTLVRHMSRAPHKLEAQDRFISSFNVQGAEHTHAKAAVCKRCWRTFRVEETFTTHISNMCDKVSKGKKEKWQILYDAFTPLGDAPAASSITPAGVNQPIPVQLNDSSHHPILDPGTPSTSVPSPDTMALAPAPLQTAGGNASVPLTDYLRLCHRMQQIEQQQQVILLLIALAGRSRGIEGQTSPLRALESGNGAEGAAVTLVEDPDDIGGDDNDDIDGVQTLPDDQPDRESLVGHTHLNALPVEVDLEGLMNDAEQSLTRASSGISSDRSTLRHVPTSPPTRYDAFQPGSGGSARTGNATGLNTRTPVAHQPTSLPDSGYGSDKKRNSLGDLDLGEQSKKASSLPEPIRAAYTHYSHPPLGLPTSAPLAPSSSFTDALRDTHMKISDTIPASTMSSTMLTDPVIETNLWDPAYTFAPASGESQHQYHPEFDMPDPMSFPEDMFRSPESQELPNHEFRLDREL